MAQIGIDRTPKGPSTYGLRPLSRRRANATHALQILRASCTWPRSVSMAPQKGRIRMGYGPCPGGELTRHTRPTSFTSELYLAQIGIDRAPKGPSTYGLRFFSRRRANATHALQVLRASCTWPRSVTKGAQKTIARMGYGPLPGGEVTRHTSYKVYERVVLGPDRCRCGPKRPEYVWDTSPFQVAS